jgi:CDGSH-type Zn-finger protein
MDDRLNRDIETNGMSITVRPDGPYIVKGDVPLVVKTQVVSEHGEPLTWKREGTLPTGREYRLCRCGQSRNKPFCDDSHLDCDFDGTETADTGPGASLPRAFRGGTRIVVRKDPALCIEAGFCGLKDVGMPGLVAATEDSKVRSLVIAMVERCPSGSLTYSIEPDEPPIEPDLPLQIADTVEITSDGPIAGPLWVTGCIPIIRADGQPFEPRNRVTLCNCGHSANKPLCDGTHRRLRERALNPRR